MTPRAAGDRTEARTGVRAYVELAPRTGFPSAAKVGRRPENVLGFEFHSQFPETDPTIVFLAIQDQDSALSRGGHPVLLALIDPLRHGPAKHRFDGINRRQSSLNHLAFEIDGSDYESERTRLEKLGLQPSTEKFPNVKALALFFDDPEGNLLEFICHAGSVE